MAWSWFASGGDGNSLIRRGVRLFLIEGAVCGVMCACTDNWLVPLLTVHLGATGALIGYLTTIPMLGLVTVGVVARPVIKFLGGNRVATVIVCGTQTLMLLGLIIPVEFAIPGRLAMAMAMCLVFGLIGTLGGTPWNALVGGLLPRSMSGRLSGLRFRLFQVSKVVFGLGFTGIFQIWPIANHPHALAAVLVVAAIARSGSTLLLYHTPELPSRPTRREPLSEGHAVATVTFLDFLKGLGRTRVGAWSLAWSVMVFGCTVTSPFMAPYFVRPRQDGGMGLDLRPYDYWLLCNIAVLTRIAMVPLIGRAVDLLGASAMLRVGMLGVCFNIVPYIFTERLPLLYATEVFGGLSWCTVEIAMGVLMLSCSRDPLQRTRLISFCQVVSGGAILLGGLLGQLLLSQLESGSLHRSCLLVHGNAYRSLFVIGSLLRWPGAVLAVVLLPRLRALNDQETRGLWRLVPGLSLSVWVSRSLFGVVRRAIG